jgi:thermopsin
MNARRATVGLALLVTMVMVVSSMGLLAAVAPPAAPRSASLAPPAVAAPRGTSPTTLTGDSATPTAHLGSESIPLTPPSAPAAGETNTPAAQKILSSLSARGVPLHDVFLPYLMNGPHPALTNGHVDLTYTSSPAPYGIGEYGLENDSGVITPYTLATPSVEANFSTNGLTGYSPDISGPDEWGVQLNAVLNNVTLFGTGGYQFWTQNVFEYSPSNSSLTFVSNIWNFSAYDASLTCNSIYSSNGFNECPEYYYGESAPIPTTVPFTVQLYLNSSLENGRDAVFFNYSLTQSSGTTSGSYNYAIFNSLAAGGNPAATKAPAFVANGSAYNPAGLPDDFEITLGGPGGGSNFDVYEASYTYMTLQYWNTTADAYLTVPSAFNTGGDTGETSVGVNAAWSSFTNEGIVLPPEIPASCQPCVTLSNGPSFQYGLWGVLGAGVGGYSPYAEASFFTQSDLYATLEPGNAFLFLADGLVFSSWEATNYSLFQWVPDFDSQYDYIALPVGNYTAIVVMSEFDPTELEFTIVGNDFDSIGATLAPAVDTLNGVYTPLWAFNVTGLQNISSAIDGYGNYLLFNNEFGNIGQVPFTTDFIDNPYFPWFGLVNDYGFPVFPGILLFDLTDVDIVGAPSFTVALPPAPSYDQNIASYFGWPSTNNLQMFFWDDDDVSLESSAISGWWPAVSYFGLSQSSANAVFWNTSGANIVDNTFATQGMALFLYGGVYNEIYGNVFTTGADPTSSQPYPTVAEYYGSIGLVDADWGDANDYGAAAFTACDECDEIANNAFNTVVTADSPTIDPYTGLAPDQFQDEFSQAWNGPLDRGMTNIIGGNYTGGNYWWDYGFADNPYGVLPDAEYNDLPYYESDYSAPAASICVDEFGNCDSGQGDYYPLVNVALFNITFKEQGLPTGTSWGVELYVPPLYYYFQDEYQSNSSNAPGWLNMTEPAGTWYYYPSSNNENYAAFGSSVTITNHSVVVVVRFLTAYTLTVTESGLPAGTWWYADADNYTFDFGNGNSTNTATLVIRGLLPGVYNFYSETEDAAYGKYVGTPYDVNIDISGPTTVHVTFEAAYSLSVHAVGLPSGARWLFTATSSTDDNLSEFTSDTWANFTVGAGAYDWQASSVGEAASPSSGVVTVGSNLTLTITFVNAATATGTLSGTISPSGATLWVDGTQETVGSGGTFSLVLPIGIHSVEVKDSGYATYFNNVTVSLSETTTLNIDLTSVSSTSSSGAAGISGLGWALIGLLAALAVILLVTTLIFARRGRNPPPPTAFVAPPAVAGGAGAPPSGAAAPPPPAWQEPPPPPPAGGSS